MFKNIIKIAIIIAMTSTTMLAQFSGGAGTEASPYQIKTKNDLMNIRDEFAIGHHYKLMNDIRDSLREPIPHFENSTFDGQGYKITLAMDGDGSNMALFLYICDGVEIMNLVVDGYVKNCFWCAGFIAATSYDTTNKTILLKNLINVTRIEGEYGAGITSNMHQPGIIESCINIGTIISEKQSAGITAGSAGGANSTIFNCINASFLKGDGTSNFLVTSGISVNERLNNIHSISNCLNLSPFESKIKPKNGIVGFDIPF